MPRSLSTTSHLSTPFELRELLRPVFTSTVPSTDVSKPSKAPVVRAVDGYNSFIWVGSNDGQVKGLEVRPQFNQSCARPTVQDSCLSEDQANSTFQFHPPSGISSKPNSPISPLASSSNWISVQTDCFQGFHLFPASENGKPKAVEKLILVPIISLAVVLSEGTLTFHSISDLKSRSSSSFQSAFPLIRGVSAVTLDEDTYNFHHTKHPTLFQPVIMCVIKKKTICLYSLGETAAQQIREIAIVSAAFQCLLRGSTLLLADIEQYYLVSLRDQRPQAMPLLDISRPTPSTPDDETMSSQTTRHRPSMSAIPNSNEFLLASHTGSTCLGIFVSESGDPSRGTLEWPSNPRNVLVDLHHVMALLFNGTVEIHLLATQELVQVISLPAGLDPRSLAPTKFGLSIPRDLCTSQVAFVAVPLAPHSLGLPTSPSSRGSIADGSTLTETYSRTLLVGRDSLHALVTRPFLAEIEYLIEHNCWDEALRVANQSSNPDLSHYHPAGLPISHLALSAHSHSQDVELISQLRYAYQKIAFHFMYETKFDEAGDLWLKGQGDPRVFIKLFPRLSSLKLFQNDTITIHKGLEYFVRDGGNIEDLITMNLVRNYSPHIKPDVETALSTIELKTQLQEKAQRMLLQYLRRWKRDRLLRGGASDKNRQLDSIVDTTLVELLSARRAVDPEAYAELKVLLDRPNCCISSEVEMSLLKNGCFCLLGEFYMKHSNTSKALDLWTKLHDKYFIDKDFSDSLDRIIDLLLKLDQPEIVSHYAIWMAQRDCQLAVKVLINSVVSNTLDVYKTFESLQNVNIQAARLYLEQVVLRTSRKFPHEKKKANSLDDHETSQLINLRTRLILEYLKGLKGLFASPQGKPCTVLSAFRRLVEDYISCATGEPIEQQSFIEYLISLHNAQAESHHLESELHQAMKMRMKLIVCLDQSHPAQPSYDAAQIKAAIEELGGSAEVMAFERAIVYSKLGLHRPALSLLAVILKDLRGAETYCLRGGSLLTTTQANKLFPIGLSPAPKSRSFSFPDFSPSELLAILFDLLIDSTNPPNQVALFLARRASHIPIKSALSRLPAHWFLAPVLAPYLTRALRRSCHVQHESMVMKSVALGHQIALEIKWEDQHARPFNNLDKNFPSLKGATDSNSVHNSKIAADDKTQQ
ncbi:hypothetical protein O181_040812 [Austropuccinia psidii MF-1]|uniref:CNH domain-containing protein n=1 Tax=Austropuccinia psidii MF-1 TaxID=1389203 RepID=A0A9Q3DFK7_9BASI|nr:hypothetical protein [Austropuccinia psidii MF-1]